MDNTLLLRIESVVTYKRIVMLQEKQQLIGFNLVI